MITPSLGFKVINARGFTNTTNVRFVQMVDGMDIQAPHIGAPMANALGPGDLDMQSVEVLPGAASALYGMNAINGTANFIMKDPFLTQGLSFMQKAGMNHLGDEGHDPAHQSIADDAATQSSELVPLRVGQPVQAGERAGEGEDLVLVNHRADLREGLVRDLAVAQLLDSRL